VGSIALAAAFAGWYSSGDDDAGVRAISTRSTGHR
jgi:hypothetical protein